MSFNIWSDAPRNRSWIRRRDRIADVLRRHLPDIAGLQEATVPMIRDLHARLPEFHWVGVGREDGRELGECAPIFFRANRFTLVEQGHFWLAENCDLPGRGWDALCHRVVTWARLAETESGRVITHFNTHFDHLGRRAREQSAHLLLRKIADIGGTEPVVVSGDFNCRETSAPYLTLIGRRPFKAPAPDYDSLRDSRYESATPPTGPAKTFRGLLGMLGMGRIDYVFVKNGIRTERHAVLDEAQGASDHRPMLVEWEFAPIVSEAATAANGTGR